MRLANAKGLLAKWDETIPNGTHYLFLDLPKRGRDRFIQEVVFFLEE